MSAGTQRGKESKSTPRAKTHTAELTHRTACGTVCRTRSTWVLTRKPEKLRARQLKRERSSVLPLITQGAESRRAKLARWDLKS